MAGPGCESDGAGEKESSSAAVISFDKSVEDFGKKNMTKERLWSTSSTFL